jgi:hypothetical protein
MRRKFFGWAAIFTVVALLASIFTVATPDRAEAANARNFNPGYIISDAIFFNGNSIGATEIQSFLKSKGGTCASGSTCLSNYKQGTNSIAATANCKRYTGSKSESAANIIAKVAVACGINPKVLLVMLQKEQGLVTATSPSDLKYKIAMGYACPDTAACDQRYYGFHNQVYSAASQFKQYTRLPDRQYKIGNVAIQYNPNADCGSSVVNIQNQATANLYNYTPYQPNAAALANINGSGDGCSAYGNRNFWRYFSDWFGSPTGNVDPISNLDSITQSPGKIRVTGWTFDPNTKASLVIHVYINGKAKAFTARGNRPDVAAVHGNIGNAHGFDVTLPVNTAGNKNVCVYAINKGAGNNAPIGSCKTITMRTGDPIGSYDTVSAGPGTISTGGWAFDPDTTASIPIHVYVDGKATAKMANQTRNDVASAYPGYGSAHGFNTTIAASAGEHWVCVYGVNKAAGKNKNLGCKTVTVPAKTSTGKSGPPVGSLDSVVAGKNRVIVEGWALDPDTFKSIVTHVYVDGVAKAVTANWTRRDVAAAYPGYGTEHGFYAQIGAKPGRHEVCAYGINTGSGSNTHIGCKTVTVR